MKTIDWLYRLCRWTLGGIFIYAGGTKLLEPEIFAVLIEAYGIVPEGLLMPVAMVLVNQLFSKRRRENAYRYKNVFRYPSGIFAWKGVDFPTEKA